MPNLRNSSKGDIQPRLPRLIVRHSTIQLAKHPSAAIIDAMGLVDNLLSEVRTFNVPSNQVSHKCFIVATRVTVSKWCLMYTIVNLSNLQNVFSVVPQKE